MTDRNDKRPFWAKCGACDHCWACAYMPMTMERVAQLLINLHCPACGQDSSKVFVAKQDNGILQEHA
jgi:hypothetical protein